MRTAFASVAVIALFAHPALAERPAEVDTSRTSEIQLGYAFERGNAESHVLDAHMTAEALDSGTREPAWELILSLPLSYEVQSVNDAGNALVATSLGSPTVTRRENGVNVDTGSVLQGLRAARITATVAPNGSVVDRSTGTSEPGDRTDAVAWLADILAYHMPQFPQEPIVVGDSWLQAINHSQDDLVTSVTIRYTLAGFADHPIGNVAVIDATYTTTVEGQTTVSGTAMQRIVGRGSGEGYLLFDHEGGRIVESGLRNGVVITSSTHAGHRTMMAFNERASTRAQVVAPTLGGQQ